MNERDRALRAHHRERETHPIGEIGVSLYRRDRFSWCGVGLAITAPMKWRVRHDVVECPRGEPWRRMQQISDHHRGAGLEPVEDYVVACQADEIALHLKADEARMRHPRGEAQHRSAHPATDVKDQLMRFRRDCGGEKQRIDRDAVARGRLLHANAAAEQTVLGESGFLCRSLAHYAASPAAARTEQARR